jgi:SAM-dependent methyltransferase
MLLTDTLRQMRRRRRSLQQSQGKVADASELLESCIPSYCHANWLASFVAWSRLVACARLAERFPSPHPVLDFGAGSGEFLHMLPPGRSCFFVEQSDDLASLTSRTVPAARRVALTELPAGFFGTIFCLDSLEHNDDYPRLISVLWEALHPAGTMILSGPTENALYRAGRALSGFSGHYHETNIQEIERAMSQHGAQQCRQLVPFGMPFFAVSAWQKVSRV